MKKLLGLIFNRWVFMLLGLTALGLIVWYAFPLIALGAEKPWRPFEPERVRWITIGVIVALVLGRIIWKFAKAKLANAKLFDGMLKQAPPKAAPDEPAAEEVAILRKRFEEAVGVLKHTKLGTGEKRSGLGSLFGRQYVYELPWYMFIGAPGSGKTTALVNSGLTFPLADKFGEASIRGVGGTRNCDWWFTDEAVLIDTAGRYTTQESNRELDAGAWKGFLDLLKKSRPRRPINGVLLTVSVADLLQESREQRDAHAAALRKRLQELHEELGIRFPIYVLVTKVDLLAGFMEFFDNLGAEERAQVWGVSFPYQPGAKEAAPLARFGEEFTALEKRLNERLFDRMQQERDPQRRAAIYLLPQQFASLKTLLGELLEKVFSPSRFEEKPLLRGVYFTSGTQEGSPIDRVMGALGRAFHMERRLLPPQRPSGKSFFITRLVREVIFPEAGLAGTNLKWERRRALVQWGGLAAALLLTAGVLGIWTVSYARNSAYVAEVQAKQQAVAKQVQAINVSGDTDVVTLLPVLEAVKALPETPRVASASPPVSMTFGLYQGAKLADAATQSYERLLREAFLPRINLRVEQLLRTVGARPDALYETLKAYLMLHDTQHFDGEALKAYILFDWRQNLPREVTAEQREALKAHLDHLFAAGGVISPIPADEGLVARARTAIASVPLARRIYNRIRQEGFGTNLPEFTIAQVVGPQAGVVFRRASGEPLTKGVPGMYSFDAYWNQFVRAAQATTKELAEEEGWVLGIDERQRRSVKDVSGTGAIANEVRRLYLEEYAKTWEAFVNDIRVETGGRDRATLIQAASVLASPTSPLPVLLRAIVKEVSLVRKAEDDKSLLDKGREALEQKADRLGKLFGQQRQDTSLDQATQPERVVDDRFTELRRLVTPPAAGQPAPIDAQVALLGELAQDMVAADQAIKANTPPKPSLAADKAKAIAKQSPEPLKTMLATLGDATSQIIGGGMVDNLNSELAPIAAFCEKATSGRYPLNKNGTVDVTQTDFAQVFGPAPAGKLDKFFQEKLLAMTDTSKRPWTFRQVSESQKPGRSAALANFELASVIRDVFFQGPGGGLGMKLDFKPVEMDAAITQFILDVDGQLVRYSHGPQVIQPVLWPGPKGTGQVRISITPPTPGGQAGKVKEGPWALFHLLDEAQITPSERPEKFTVTFNVDGRKAVFEVVTSSVQNPFRLRELAAFQCPTRL